MFHSMLSYQQPAVPAIIHLTFIPNHSLIHPPTHSLTHSRTHSPANNALSACLFAGFGYAVAQFIQIFVMASFIPPSETHGFDYTEEFGRILVKALDLFAFQYLLSNKTVRLYAAARALAIVVGWGLTEAVLSNLIPYWIGTRGMEFTWDFVEMAIRSNIHMFLLYGFVSMVQCTTSPNFAKNTTAWAFAIVSLLLYTGSGSIVRFASDVLSMRRLYTIGVDAAVAGATYLCYVSVAKIMAENGNKTAKTHSQ
jgi:Predicted membrane protein (DUF2053)